MKVSQNILYREMDAEQLELEFIKHLPLTYDFEGDNEDLAGAVIDIMRREERELINKQYKQITGNSLQ